MNLHFFCSVFVTMGITSVVSFFYVHYSNLELQKTLALLNENGYVTVPGHNIYLSLDKFFPTFYSSLFISFTAGFFFVLVIGSSILLYRLFQETSPANFRLYASTALITLAAVILTGSFIADRSIFHRVRDYILLPNPIGTAVNKFYYTYTPYAANAVAAPIEKQFKSCWIAPDVPDRDRIINALSKFGWIAVPNKINTSLIININTTRQLTFEFKKKVIVLANVNKFLNNPKYSLNEYSQKIDSASFLRSICHAGLIIGLPLFLFILLFVIFTFFFKRILTHPSAILISGILIFLLMTGGLLFLYPPGKPGDDKTIRNMLHSETPKTRIEALRAIYAQTNTKRFEAYCHTHLNSEFTAERYWIAKVLSKNDSPQSLDMLHNFLNDRSAIVVKASIKSLHSRTCHKKTVNLLNGLILGNPHWYVQISAMNALRRCQ